MQRLGIAVATVGLVGTILINFGSVSPCLAADPPAKKPATIAEAAKVLDLSKLSLVAGAQEPNQRNLAAVSYQAPGIVKDVYTFHQKQLLAQKWQELPGGYVTDDYANGTFARDGYTISLSTSPGSMPKTVSVMLMNHGNIDFAKLPVPSDVKPLYSGPASTMLITETSAEKTAEACRKLLLAQGWLPYGKAGDTHSFKQNAVQLSATIASAPGQGGKTVITFSSQLMSVDLPAPLVTELLHYTDTPAQLSFDSAESQEKVVEFYKSTLAKSGWKNTTDAPIKIDFRNVMIFRNPAKDLLELQMHDFEGKTRVLLKHDTAAEVAALDKRLDEETKRKAAELNKPLPKLAVALPAGAMDVEVKKNQIEFTLPTGKAKAAVDAWRKQFAKDGWKEDDGAVAEKEAGSISLEKGSQRLTIFYADPGFIPAEIDLSASGVELEREREKK